MAKMTNQSPNLGTQVEKQYLHLRYQKSKAVLTAFPRDPED